jgi:serine/threonine-protein kinase
MAAARDSSPDRLQRLYAGDLDRILAKALHKLPAQRYPTVAALGDDLNRYLNHEPVSAQAVTWRYRARKFVRRNRGSVASAVLVTIALLGAAVITGLQAREARRQRDIAVRVAKQQRAAMSVQEVLASDTRGPGGRELTQLERIQLAKQTLQQRFRKEPWLIVEGIINLGNKLVLSGDLKSNRDLLNEARQLAIKEDLKRELVLVDCSLGKTLAYAQLFDSANASLAEARQNLALPGVFDPEVNMWCDEAQTLNLLWQGKIDSALPLATRTFDFVMDPNRPVPFDESYQRSLRTTLATALRGAGRTREALPYLRQLYAELDTSGLIDTELGAVGLSHITSALFELGEFSGVDSVVRGHLRTLEERGSKTIDRELTFLRGLSFLRLGELDSADVWLDRAVHDSAPDRETGAGVWGPPAMAQLRLEQGRLAEAKAIMATLPTGTHTRLSTAAWLRARLRWAERDTVGATRMLDSTLKELSAPGPRQPADMGLPLITLAGFHLAIGDVTGADSLLQAGIKASAVDSLTFFRSGIVGRGELVRARILRQRGDLAGSRAAAERARVALGVGYGSQRRFTLEAAALRDSLGS